MVPSRTKTLSESTHSPPTMLELMRISSSRNRNRSRSRPSASDPPHPDPAQFLEIRLPPQPSSDSYPTQHSPSAGSLCAPPDTHPHSPRTPHRRSSSFILKSSVKSLNFIRSSRLCYSSDSAFTDSIVDLHPPRNMNISSPVSVTIGRDLEGIPRQPLPAHSPATNPVTLVRTPSEAVRKLLSPKDSHPDRHLQRSPPSALARPQLPISSRSFNSTPHLPGRHFASDPKLYPVSSNTSPLIQTPSPPLVSARSGNSLDLAHQRINHHRPRQLSPVPSAPQSPSSEVASYQAWAARASPVPEPGTAITTSDPLPTQRESAIVENSRTASTPSSSPDRSQLKPSFTPHIELGKTPAVVLRRRPPPAGPSPHPPSPPTTVLPLIRQPSPTLAIQPEAKEPQPVRKCEKDCLPVPITKDTEMDTVAVLLARPPAGCRLLSLNVGGQVFMTNLANVMACPSRLSACLSRLLADERDGEGLAASRLSLDAVGKARASTSGGVRLVRSWRADETGLTNTGADKNWKGGVRHQRTSSEASDASSDDEEVVASKPVAEIGKSTGSWASTKVGGLEPVAGVLEVFLDRDPKPYRALMGYWRHSRLPSWVTEVREVMEEAEWLGIQDLGLQHKYL